jgi:hypothetical protein
MAIILGTTTLNPNMVWAERFSYSQVIQEVQTTLDGSPVIYTRNRQNGMPITLIALEDQGWLTKAMADAVQLAAQAAGATFSLTVGAETFNVIFRHHEAPAVSLRPLLTRAVPLPEDYFVGEIKLMTI